MSGGIYVASKTAHAPMWRDLRERGTPIVSTWIDEAGAGETPARSDLWRRCVVEASTADALVLYQGPGEVLKGALVEAGAALARGVPVHARCDPGLTFTRHPGVTLHGALASAVGAAAACVWRDPSTAPSDGSWFAVKIKGSRGFRSVPCYRDAARRLVCGLDMMWLDKKPLGWRPLPPDHPQIKMERRHG